jgi:hypothetical protein
MSRQSPSGGDARQQAAKYLESNFTKCGDSYYLLVRLSDSDGMFNGLYQLRGLTISLEPGRLSEADRLNGIEWTGAVEYKVRANRKYENGSWSEWRNGFFPFRPHPLVIGLVKRNGGWNVQAPSRQRIGCSSLPH